VCALALVGLTMSFRQAYAAPASPSLGGSLAGSGIARRIQLLCLGVLGQYIGRVYSEVRGRPLYVVRGGWASTGRRVAAQRAGIPFDRGSPAGRSRVAARSVERTPRLILGNRTMSLAPAMAPHLRPEPPADSIGGIDPQMADAGLDHPPDRGAAAPAFAEGRVAGTVHTCIGQEWVGVAVAAALKSGDYLFSNHRGTGITWPGPMTSRD